MAERPRFGGNHEPGTFGRREEPKPPIPPTALDSLLSKLQTTLINREIGESLAQFRQALKDGEQFSDYEKRRVVILLIQHLGDDLRRFFIDREEIAKVLKYQEILQASTATGDTTLTEKQKNEIENKIGDILFNQLSNE